MRFLAQEDKIVEHPACVPLECPDATVSSGPSGPPDREAVVQVKEERKRVTVVYSGNVQGVGFRFTTREVAAGFDVCGGVRNLPDGRVELIAEGTAGELDAFRQAIREAGLGPLIRDEVTQWSEPRGNLAGFQILR